MLDRKLKRRVETIASNKQQIVFQVEFDSAQSPRPTSKYFIGSRKP